MPVLSKFLGKRSLLVLRFASCEAIVDGAGIGGSSTSVGISPSQGLHDHVSLRRKSPRRRLLPSRRRGTCTRGLSAQLARPQQQVGHVDQTIVVLPANDLVGRSEHLRLGVAHGDA